MLVAEAIFLAIDRMVWHYDLRAETYRLIDLGVMVALVVGGVVLPVVFEKDRRRRRLIYLLVALAGVGGAVGFVLLRAFIAGLVEGPSNARVCSARHSRYVRQHEHTAGRDLRARNVVPRVP
jgi:hypothetical protein